MKKLLSLLIITTSCTTTKITLIKTPQARITYPYYIEGRTPIEQAWAKIYDVVAIEGLHGSETKEEGTFHLYLSNVSYTFEDDNGRIQDTTAIVVLPSLRYQELSGSTLKTQRIVYPDSVSISFNVRIRSNRQGDSFVNVNMPHIHVGGAHYRKKSNAGIPTSAKSLMSPDTTVARIPVAIKSDDWDGAKSSGVLERYFINLVEKTNLGKYNDHPRMPR